MEKRTVICATMTLLSLRSSATETLVRTVPSSPAVRGQIAERAFGAGGPGILQATELQLGGPALPCIEMALRVATAVEASAVDRVQLQSLRPQIAGCAVAAANLQGGRRQCGLHAIMRYELRKVCVSRCDARVFPGLEPRCQRPFPACGRNSCREIVGKRSRMIAVARRALRRRQRARNRSSARGARMNDRYVIAQSLLKMHAFAAQNDALRQAKFAAVDMRAT